MNDMKEGIMPETGVVHGEPWLICGFCMELVCQMSQKWPDKCPHCGMKIRKGAGA